MKHKKLIQQIIKWAVFLITPTIGVFLIESIIRDSYIDAYHWGLDHVKMGVISVLIYFCLQIIIFALCNNVYLGTFITLIIWLIAAVVNYYKVQMMGDPVLPWDFLFVNQLFDLLPALYKNVNLFALIFGAIIAILLIVVMVKFTAFKTFKWYIRVPILIIGLVPFYLIYTYEDNFLNKVFVDAGMTNTPWSQVTTQKNNGMMLGFIVNLPNIRVDKPDSYSKSEMTKVEEQVKTLLVNGEYETSDKKPNVVMIMSEAFWELSNLDITIDGEDVNPTITANKYGHIVSPKFGGGTSNVEFEALTGFTNTHLLGGSIPYQQYMGREMPSLAWTFKDYGYKTTAIHTYYKYFWNRIQAYESLGFDEFIGLDNLTEPKYFGNLYVSDAVITDEILKTIKKTDEPSFIYSVTMQNHGLYNDERYGSDTINAVDQYSDATNRILNNLATGYRNSDTELKRLMDELEKLDEPTLLVFFGDHLPSMTEAYMETGYVGNMSAKTLEEELKMKETPLVVWNNYGQEIEEVGSVSTSFLPPLVMKWAQLESTNFYKFLDEIRKTLPAYTSLVKQDANGQLYQQTPEQYKDLEKMYELLQYDMMFGEEYTSKSLFKK